MNKKILLGLSIITFSLFTISFKTTVEASEPSSHEENIKKDPIMYDKFGQVVEPIDSLTSIEPLGTNAPTASKWLNVGQSYLSQPFSGSGRRYGGYIFGLNGTNNVQIELKIGGFGVNVTDRFDPGAVIHRYNLPLNHSPYKLTNVGFFYFLVDNPKNGQTYRVKPVR